MELPEGSEKVIQATDEPTLNQEQPANAPEPATEPVTGESASAASCDEATTNPTPEEEVTKATILARLETLSTADPSEVSAEEIARCKQQFYGLHNEELRKQRAAFIEAGNAPEAFVPADDPDEERMKELLGVIKESKARLREQQDAQRQANYERKLEIIKEIASLSEDTDNINRHHQRARELQAEFRSIGEVPPQFETSVWKDYQEAVETFYDQVKINKELYDYDLKKNLGEKQLLVAEAISLKEEPDVITAFRRLQDLHNKWREIGPVPKEQREDLWSEFKDASAAINRRYQTYFEERKAREQENETAKTALCERIEALDFTAVKSFSEWDAMTKQIIDAQNEWKTLGFASRKANNALFNRFRATCDKFFAAKAEYYRTTKEEFSANLAAKTALCEEAEALKDSTDWRAATDKFVELQRRWKETGAVGRRQSDSIWKRFQTACDYFFDQKKKNAGAARRTEQANLKAKKELVGRMQALLANEENLSNEQIVEAVRTAQDEWKAIGHVPFRDKEKVYEQFRAAIDALYEKFDLRGHRQRMNKFEANIENLQSTDQQKLSRERERLMRALEGRRAELQTYQNNLGFLSSKSKDGNSMVREIERRVDRIKEDVADLTEKIKLIDSRL